MDSNAYIVILAVTITLSSISYYLNSYLTKVSNTQKATKAFILFFSGSCIFTFLTKFYLPDLVFISLGPPFIMYYGPFFFYFMVCLARDNSGHYICRTKIWNHFLIPGIFSVVYLIGALNANNLSIEFLVYYYLCLYLVTGVLLAIYGIFGYLMLMRGNLTPQFRFFLLGVIWYMLFMAIIIIGLGFYHAIPNNDQDIIYLGMFFLSMIMFNYCRKRVIHVKSNYKDTSVANSQAIQSVLVSQANLTLDQEEQTDSNALDFSGKYIKSQLSEEYLRSCQKKIEHYAVELKYYKQVDFNVDKLRELTGIPKYHIAQAFTVLYGMNFNSFINEKRIEYALLVLDQEDYRLSVNDLAELSGFNSRTSFFRAFKKKTNMSPTQYIEEHKLRKY